MPNIYIYGSFDRFNFGDILFPLILKKHFTSSPKFTTEYNIITISPFKGDETKRGGIKTASIKTIIKKLKDKDTIIIAGGDVLPVKWLDLYLHRDNTHLKYRIAHKLLSYFSKSPSFLIATFIQKIYGDKSLPLPYAISKTKNINLIYNSVGGASVNNDFANTNYTDVISNADIFAVRDSLTKTRLPNQQLISVIPDVAILTKDLLPISKELNSAISKKSFFTLQIGKAYLGDNQISIIANELNKIIKHTGLTLLLLPIGTAHGHEDHIALRKLIPYLEPGLYDMIEDPSMQEIQAYISNSQFFIGTSLHGAITSMSYYRPHFALNFEISKLNAYINTWQVDSFNEAVEVSDFSKTIITFLQSNFDHEKYIEHINSQKVMMSKQLQAFNQLIFDN